MNYAVVRRADTKWGSAFAFELAGQKRHLILLGSVMDVLRDLAVRIRSQYQVYIHYFIVDESDIADIISTCNHINAHFEVDMLINHLENRVDRSLGDLDVNRLAKELKAGLLASPIFTHQLLPNLMLHVNAAVLELRNTSFPRNFPLTDEMSYRAEIPGVRESYKDLPWTNSGAEAETAFRNIAMEVLDSLTEYEDEIAF